MSTKPQGGKPIVSPKPGPRVNTEDRSISQSPTYKIKTPPPKPPQK